jgi:hypothetical protein
MMDFVAYGRHLGYIHFSFVADIVDIVGVVAADIAGTAVVVAAAAVESTAVVAVVVGSAVAHCYYYYYYYYSCADSDWHHQMKGQYTVQPRAAAADG